MIPTVARTRLTVFRRTALRAAEKPEAWPQTHRQRTQTLSALRQKPRSLWEKLNLEARKPGKERVKIPVFLDSWLPDSSKSRASIAPWETFSPRSKSLREMLPGLRQTSSPMRQAPSPKRQTPSPKRQTSSPMWQTTSPISQKRGVFLRIAPGMTRAAVEKCSFFPPNPTHAPSAKTDAKTPGSYKTKPVAGISPDHRLCRAMS